MDSRWRVPCVGTNVNTNSDTNSTNSFIQPEIIVFYSELLPSFAFEEDLSNRCINPEKKLHRGKFCLVYKFLRTEFFRNL